MEADLRKDLIKAFPLEFETILGLIDKALESEKGCFLKDGEWSLSLDVEKQHCLQYYYYMAISKPTSNSDDIELNVKYENGINNGTMLMDYCLDGTPTHSPTKEVQVIIGIEPDWEEYKDLLSKSKNPGFLKKKIAYLVKSKEDQILKLHKDRGYDNYVTGGGTNITDKYYRSEIEKFHKANIFWVPVLEVIEVDRVLV